MTISIDPHLRGAILSLLHQLRKCAPGFCRDPRIRNDLVSGPQSGAFRGGSRSNEINDYRFGGIPKHFKFIPIRNYRSVNRLASPIDRERQLRTRKGEKGFKVRPLPSRIIYAVQVDDPVAW